jgi:dihydrofolate synthase/folylpolyglutamate synthase
MPDPPRLDDVLDRLDARINWERRDRSSGWRVDLAPMVDLVARAGGPSRGFSLCHVAGSKGKGSVANLVAAGLIRAGLRVGVFGSPHVERINERIRIDGEPLGDEPLAAALVASLELVEEAEEAGTDGAEASWFDIVTLAGLWAFREAGVDWAVLEVGLGGRLDSTNVIDPPEVAVVTTIALEHTAILGDTLAAIAREKGGIVKPGSPLVTGTPPGGEAHGALAEIAERVGVEHVVAWSGADRTFEEANVRVARAALDVLGLDVPGLGGELLTPDVIRAARLPGRMEWLTCGPVRVLLDGAHVPTSLEMAVGEALGVAQDQASARWGAVVAIHGEKDLRELLGPLAARDFKRVFATTVPGTGVHHAAAAVGQAADALGLEAEVHDLPEGALRSALEWAEEDGADPVSGAPAGVMVTGSLYLVGALRARLQAPTNPG